MVYREKDIVWGHQIVKNSRVCKMLEFWPKYHGAELEKSVNAIFEYSDNLYAALFAVELVDISLNGIDKEILGSFCEQEEWFRSIDKTPMRDLREKAIAVIRKIQQLEEKQNNWCPDVKVQRRQLLEKIEKRLIGAADIVDMAV